MLLDAIGDLLPSAFAVALSPFPLVAVVAVLGGAHARTAGPAFAAGWIVGLASVSVVVALLVGSAGDADGDDPGLGWLKVALGLLFLAMAVAQWRRRPKRDEERAEPGWMATIDRAAAPRAALLGVALSAANPKNLALTLAASASVAEAGLGDADTAIALAVFVAVGSASVVGLVLFHLIGGERATRPLAAIKQFMSDNNAVIMFVVLLLLGAKLLGDGIAAL